MLIIAALSQKGGVGKSTLARLIARTYAANGWRVKIADFNVKQGTSTEWVKSRLRYGVEPAIAGEPVTAIKEVLRQDYDLMVIDGRPDAETSSAEIAKVAHAIIVPTGSSFDDLKPQVDFARELQSRGVRVPQIFFVLNKTGRSPGAVKEALGFIERFGFQSFENELPFMQAYENAQNLGRAVSESDYPTLNERADALGREIAAKIGELTRKKA